MRPTNGGPSKPTYFLRRRSMAISIKVAVYTNSDDAFVAWAPTEFIPECRGFLLERGRKTTSGDKIDIVENRVGFSRDKPKSGEHRPSTEWPFQRFNWTDHAADVGDKVRYRATPMVDDGFVHPGKQRPAHRACRCGETVSRAMGQSQGRLAPRT